jgi:hypothetical protein
MVLNLMVINYYVRKHVVLTKWLIAMELITIPVHLKQGTVPVDGARSAGEDECEAAVQLLKRAGQGDPPMHRIGSIGSIV